MVTDIGHVFLGVKHYICAPEPIDGISPVTHIAFKDESLMIPDSLEIKPRKTGKGEKKRISRRSQSYNESRPSSMMPSRQSSMRQPSIRRFDPVTEAVMSDIDRTMEPLEMSDDEHDIIEEDEDRVSIGSVQREPSPEPVYEAPVEKAPTRRVNRRRKFVDSKDSIAVQVSDVLSGFVMRYVQDSLYSDKQVDSNLEKAFVALKSSWSDSTNVGVNFVIPQYKLSNI